MASLLGVNAAKLGYALCHSSVIVQGDVEETPNTIEQSESARDALARGLYSRLVDWLVNTLNINLILGRKVLYVLFFLKHCYDCSNYYFWQ